MMSRMACRSRILGWIVCLGFALGLPGASLALGPATRRPVGPDGRAVYQLARLTGVSEAQYALLTRLGFILERNGEGQLFAYLAPAEIAKLARLGIGWEAVEEPPPPEPPAPGTDALSYHDYDQLTAALQQVTSDHPDITRLTSAGQTVDGRELWWLLITDNPDVEEDEPGFKYISTMHGDEPVGTEMLLQLIDWLTDGYGSDARATRLVQEAEIWIMPMMNPDGNARGQRFNANGADLNRNFPDKWDDPVDEPAGREPETRAIMTWQEGHSTALSANFHTGALVTNYPYDNNETGASVYTATPDDDTAIDLSLDYAEDNPPMHGSSSFDQGITNGADWYVISGGMQDWNYDYRGDIEVTVELNNTKWPPAGELEQLWLDNEESMISYLERALTGVRGIVTDEETGLPLEAELRVGGRDVPFYSDPEIGDFHRPLPAGEYTLIAEAPGYAAASIPFSVADARADAVRVDVALSPLPTTLAHAGHRVDQDSDGDGYLEAGESGRLAVTLRNDGRSATGITGLLFPLTPYASSSEGGGWPDLEAGTDGESLPPHLPVEVSPSVPAGHQLGFSVSWQTAEGAAGETDAFFVPVGEPSTNHDPATDLPKPIQDNSTVESTLQVADDALLAEVNVRVDITHTYIGDLTVTLVAPDGTQVRLHDRGGGSADDIHTWYDTETSSVDDLGVLAGKPSAGTWTLRVEDHAGGDEGTLDGWTLESISRPFEDPVAEVLLRRVGLTEGGGVRLEWWPVGTAESYRVHRSDAPSREEAFLDATGEDGDPTDTAFVDSDPRNFLCWIISGVGHLGEGLWGHFSR